MKKRNYKIIPNSIALSSVTELSLADRRLFNYLLLNALEHSPRKMEYIEISFESLKGVYGNATPAPSQLIESIRKLQRTLIEYSIENSCKIFTTLLGDILLCAYECKLVYSISKSCQPILINPKSLDHCLTQAHFTHKYSYYLYNLLSDELQKNHKPQLTIETAELRAQLQIHEKKLNNFCDFERFALKPACEEINSYARFSIKFEKIKKGVKIIAVKFYLFKKESYINLENQKNSSKETIPPRRPIFFIENPQLEYAYSQLLISDTRTRNHYFNLAKSEAKKNGLVIPEEDLDRPDLWIKWISKILINSFK